MRILAVDDGVYSTMWNYRWLLIEAVPAGSHTLDCRNDVDRLGMVDHHWQDIAPHDSCPFSDFAHADGNIEVLLL